MCTSAGRVCLLVFLIAGCASTNAPTLPGGSSSRPAREVTLADGPGSTDDPLRDVVLVGNSVAGTVSVVDGHSWAALGSIDVVPDLQQRLDEIAADPLALVAYDVLRDKQRLKHFEPHDGDRFVDDVFVSPDGSTLYVSRSNLGDVAAFDLSQAGQPLLWRTHVDGWKADHATLSPDGKRLVVSATSVDKADVLDAASGVIVGTFATGHFPHQNDFSADGRHIYNGSIGDVSLPFAQQAQKGARQLTVVDAMTLQVVRTYAFDRGVRPSVLSSDGSTLWAQLSYLNGLVRFELATGTIAQTLETPTSAFASATYATEDDYPHDSAHHGLALSGDGTRLCDCGTIDNTVSIVDSATLSVLSTTDTGMIPYWSTTSTDGSACVVSLSGADAVAIYDYATGAELARTPVGRFPQRSRLGALRQSAIARLTL